MKKNLPIIMSLMLAATIANAQYKFDQNPIVLKLSGLASQSTAGGVAQGADMVYDNPGLTPFFPDPDVADAYKSRLRINQTATGSALVTLSPTGVLTFKGSNVTSTRSTYGDGLIKASFYDIANTAGIVKIALDIDMSQFTGESLVTFGFGNSGAVQKAGSTNKLLNNIHLFNNTNSSDIFGAVRIGRNTSNNTRAEWKVDLTTTGVTTNNGNPTQMWQNNTTANTHVKYNNDVVFTTYPTYAPDLVNQRLEIYINTTNAAIDYLPTGFTTNQTLAAKSYRLFGSTTKNGYSEYNGLKTYADGTLIGFGNTAFPSANLTHYTESVINALTIQIDGAFVAGITQAPVAIKNLSITNGYEEVLPVTLTSFKANKVQDGIQLNWNTVSEKDNAYFEVLKSTDGQTFTSIGKVEGAGTSVATKSYSLVDNNPAAGNNYYKLKQVDNNGKEILYNDQIQVVNFGLTSDDVNAFIADNKLSVKINSASAANATIELTSIAGQNVFSKKVTVSKGSSDLSYDLGSLAKGVYVAKISLNGAVKTVKLLN